MFRLADQEEEGGADTWNLWGILKVRTTGVELAVENVVEPGVDLPTC